MRAACWLVILTLVLLLLLMLLMPLLPLCSLSLDWCSKDAVSLSLHLHLSIHFHLFPSLPHSLSSNSSSGCLFPSRLTDSSTVTVIATSSRASTSAHCVQSHQVIQQPSTVLVSSQSFQYQIGPTSSLPPQSLAQLQCADTRLCIYGL